jgi:hypothetical protein
MMMMMMMMVVRLNNRRFEHKHSPRNPKTRLKKLKQLKL